MPTFLGRLVSSYNYGAKADGYPNGLGVLVCNAYDPNTKQVLDGVTYENRNMYIYQLDGQKISVDSNETNYKNDGTLNHYIIDLDDTQQIKLLKMFDPNQTMKDVTIFGKVENGVQSPSTMDYKDLIKVKGTYKKVNTGSIIIEHAQIIN